MSESIEAPRAKQTPKQLETHDHVRVDNYYWLNDRENQEVIDHLNRENDYFKAKMAHTESFQEDLFEELKARIKEDDESVPYKYNGYWYITKFENQLHFPTFFHLHLYFCFD